MINGLLCPRSLSLHPFPLRKKHRLAAIWTRSPGCIPTAHLISASGNLQSGNTMKKFLIVVLLVLLALPVSVSALVTYSGNQVNILDPVPDDVFATGGMIEVNAPVRSITAAGGSITINAPVSGDVIAAGGTVTINGDIGGKVVAVGGTIDLAGNVTTNVLLQGGTVTIRESATLGERAKLSGGT